MKYALLLMAAMFLAPTKARALSLAMDQNDRLEKVFLTGKFTDDATKALDGMIAEGTDRLRAKGHNAEADKIGQDWAYRYHDFLVQSYDVGDHAAIQWLYDVWHTLDSILGTNVMKMTHLDDLWEFAYTIPVVFNCLDHVDSPEYQKHFVMFAGATSYWVAMGVCAGALFGTPYAIICSPVGDVCEKVMDRWIAPKISPKVWDKVCNGN